MVAICSTPDKFWKRVSVGIPTECWFWRGRYVPGKGGEIRYCKQLWTAHRLAYYLTYGEASVENKHVYHTCGNNLCCNPDHMSVDVRPHKNDPEKFWTHIKTSDKAECWEWQNYRNECGYGITSFLGKQWNAHRLAYILTFGDIPEGMYVCHACDNRACCNPSHLFLGTPLDNHRDMTKKCRQVITVGEDRSHKITEQMVRDIRKEYSTGKVSQRSIGKKYGISHRHVSGIVNLTSWKHVI